MTPVRPPIRNVQQEAEANSIGVRNAMRPPHIVPIQLKNFTPVGTAISIDMTAEERAAATAPGGEHVVGPHADGQTRRCASVAKTRPL